MTTLSSLAEAQGGFFTRADALDSGYIDRDLQSGLRSGQLVRLRHGAYAPAEAYRNLGDAQRHVILARAVVRQQSGQVALTGHSAAAVHDLSVFGQDLDVVHLIRLDGQHAKIESGVKHHRRPRLLSEEDLVECNGLLVPSVARTVWEVASMSPLIRGVCTADSALHRHEHLADELRALAPQFQRRPGTRIGKMAVTLADGGAESEGESITRVQCFRFGIPRPTLQFEVFSSSTGRLIGRSDFYWDGYRHLGEFDGKTKYVRYLREGESIADVVVREKHREDEMRGERYGMSRFIWMEVMPQSARTNMMRLARDLEQSRSLYCHNRVIIAS